MLHGYQRIPTVERFAYEFTAGTLSSSKASESEKHARCWSSPPYPHTKSCFRSVIATWPSRPTSMDISPRAKFAHLRRTDRTTARKLAQQLSHRIGMDESGVMSDVEIGHRDAAEVATG